MEPLYSNERIGQAVYGYPFGVSVDGAVAVALKMRDEYEAALAKLRERIAELEAELADANTLLDVESK